MRSIVESTTTPPGARQGSRSARTLVAAVLVRILTDQAVPQGQAGCLGTAADADCIATLSLADVPTYVELTDGTAGLVLQVTVAPTGPATLQVLVSALGEGGDGIEFETKSNSPEQTYATATLDKIRLARGPPNG